MFSVKEVEALPELFMKISNSVTDDGNIHKEAFQLVVFGNSEKELCVARGFYFFD